MQKSLVACRPLADWLGQSVRFQGYLNHWETANKTGDTGFLLRNVEVVPYKGCRKQSRILDHTWIYLKKGVHVETKFERFGEYAAVGRVVSYTRSNGTKDFAVDIKSFVPIESHLVLFKLCREPKLDHIKTKTIILKEMLDSLEIEELDFGIYLSYEEVYQHFQNEYEFCRSQVEINERYQAKKQYRAKPNTNVVKFAAAASKSTKVAGKGFAMS
ncbi:MAG: hypothetical protein HC840_10800 [Leptolyngbyaceae cyanobacterium RM2_2_4]|nr:hypothetical protein [Leptolyngbyaceae cyanobacterium SM1_4_3]NJN89732.1 hypothetical protein [Leptolyngbyaceae cyanobacterium SL_5_14]NJO49840.1 hypothetical protein [Leptolyngbyaceae cyanobacterium RM2_2_4]